MKKKKFKKADDFPFCFSTNFFHFSYEFSIFLRRKNVFDTCSLHQNADSFPGRWRFQRPGRISFLIAGKESKSVRRVAAGQPVSYHDL